MAFFWDNITNQLSYKHHFLNPGAHSLLIFLLYTHYYRNNMVTSLPCQSNPVYDSVELKEDIFRNVSVVLFPYSIKLNGGQLFNTLFIGLGRRMNKNCPSYGVE